jgi:formylmethanofuran dehydrogenase subunit D
LFIVAQDIFPTETTAIADVVLPAAQWGEKTGCFTNVDRTVHLAHKAVEPPGEARSDFDIFVEFARRMDFQDKEGCPLMPWNKPEDAFDAWKRLSKGRPCDYSGMSYEMLTGGSGIQWPCNEDNPMGKERLFEDGVFFTDIEYCESFGHDLETGAPISKGEYQQLQPNGRAILKACRYIPDPEDVDDEYPLQLSTGRNVYHFHTRTKTGRSKPLQDASSEPIVRINDIDAADLGICNGDQVIVSSRRGEIQVKAAVGKISRGQTFIPFHFGYFDSKDGRARAANELTLERWDSVSKQPRFKSGAVRIQRCSDAQQAHNAVIVKSQQIPCEQKAARNKPNAADVGNDAEREQHLAHWMGATCQALCVLQDTFSGILPRLVTDLEVQSGVKVLEQITTHALDTLRPFCQRYHTKSKYGHDVSEHLRNGLFPPQDSSHSAYETLVVLTGLQTYISSIDAYLSTLMPVSQALWDADFVSAVQEANSDVARMQKWVRQQLSVRAAQTLIVPDLNVLGEDVRWTEK